jgi:glycosyltransferase involved in cell wall biosynthesis
MNVPGIEELARISARPKILFLGRISKYKGVELLCEAMKGISPDTYEKFIVAGEPNYPIKLPKIEKMEFHNRWLNEKDIAELVNASDIMVFPYIEATQSGALTIAIQALRPIVCTNVGGLAEQIGNGEALIVPPDSNKLRQALETLIGKPELREQMKSNLRRKKQELSWDLISKQLESIVQA